MGSPLLTDLLCPAVPKKYFFIFFSLLLSAALFFLGLLVDRLSLAVLACVVFGLGIGGVAAFMSVIFAESLCVGDIQDTLGLMYLFTGLWLLPFLPVLGFLKSV